MPSTPDEANLFQPMASPLFRASSARLKWLGARQAVLAANVANADTPGYRPNDLKEPDFRDLMRGALGGTEPLRLRRSEERHLPEAGPRMDVRAQRQRDPWEIAPAGNAVVLEEQARMIAQTNSAHGMVTAIQRKYVEMIRIAVAGPQG